MIRVVQESLSTISTDAVMRAIRSDLGPINAMSRDLLLAAGEEVEERLRRVGVLPLGGAVITPGGNLASAFLIHVVVMSDSDPQTAATVQIAVINGLRRASDLAIESLAVPPLGIGVGLIDPEASARALVDILVDHLNQREAPLDLTIAATSPYELDLFTQIVEQVAWGSTGERG